MAIPTKKQRSNQVTSLCQIGHLTLTYFIWLTSKSRIYIDDMWYEHNMFCIPDTSLCSLKCFLWKVKMCGESAFGKHYVCAPKSLHWHLKTLMFIHPNCIRYANWLKRQQVVIGVQSPFSQRYISSCYKNSMIVYWHMCVIHREPLPMAVPCSNLHPFSNAMSLQNAAITFIFLHSSKIIIFSLFVFDLNESI